MQDSVPLRCIAVVTVCRNPGAQLRDALESVRSLSDPRVRHIVIDGASTDGTVEYLRSVEHSLHYWISEPDRGIYDAMNKGWAAAPEDSYVLYIGADDLLLSLPSAEELTAAEAAGHRLVCGTTATGTSNFTSQFAPSIRWHNTVHHQSLLVRADLFTEPPFDARWRVYADWDLNIRLWRDGVSAAQYRSLRSYASPGGVSSKLPVLEFVTVAARNSGAAFGLAALGAILVAQACRQPAIAWMIRKAKRLRQFVALGDSRR